MTVVSIGPFYAFPGKDTIYCKWFDPSLRALKSHRDHFEPEVLKPIAVQGFGATMSNEFKVGDVVQLISGGPNMTVVSICSDLATPDLLTIWVEWFNPDCSDYAFPRLATICVK